MVDQISAELANRGQNGLYALVNNAGGGSIAPVELMDVVKFHVELQARILGPVALLQALLPRIREARGRVVWIVTPAHSPISNLQSPISTLWNCPDIVDTQIR
jgi:NAD(P)-dependent dehydrogenase (short-subunit alcohol dehydrogenase family)